MNHPAAGPIGMRMFLIHALAGSELIKILAQKVPLALRPDLRNLSTVAMLHNIGFPLFADLFPLEFGHLSDFVTTNSQLPLKPIEQFLFGVTHCELGTWLLKSWLMPDVIIDVAFHHHNPYYRGRNYVHNLLTFISDSLLGRLDIGDGRYQFCTDEITQELSLDRETCEQALAIIEQKLPFYYELADDLIGCF